jgi:hypothetical protein
MKAKDRDSLRRLRETEAELDSTAAESTKLRKKFTEALRTDSEVPWPPLTREPTPGDSGAK